MPHISLITLGVADIAAATRFYQALGFALSKSASQPSVSFFRAGPVVLALYGRETLQEDARAGALWSGLGGVALAQNLESPQAVNVFMARAHRAGATILKPAEETSWGGYAGYFADLDGHVWEVAFNPDFPLLAEGRISLPD